VFTGIVEEVGRVASASNRNLVINAGNILHRLEPGGSIAVNGACLTVTGFDAASFAVDIMPETLKRTNLGLLHMSDKVNLERALALGERVGGHLVQGHVDEPAIEDLNPVVAVHLKGLAIDALVPQDVELFGRLGISESRVDIGHKLLGLLFENDVDHTCDGIRSRTLPSYHRRHP